MSFRHSDMVLVRPNNNNNVDNNNKVIHSLSVSMAQIEHFSPRTMDLFQYWDWKLCFLKSILGKGDWPVARKLKMFSSQWRKLIGDPWVSSIIEQDLSLDLMSIPGKNPIESFHLQSDNHIAMSQEVLSMLEKRVIEICPEHKIGVVSPMFVVPKKDGKRRPVWDGRWINKHLARIHFKMENLLTVKETIRRGDWMVVINLKDAYFHIPLSGQAQKFLQFHWDRRVYRFHCLPFRVSVAP